MHTTIYTIGHSTQPIEDFVRLLQDFGIEVVVDVRTVPKSRHNPQFNQDALREALQMEGIGYLHLKALGGLRHTTKASINTAWKNLSFRGFADYMQTEEFQQGLAQLMQLAAEKSVAIMCAEAVPWRCHRSLIADALTVRNYSVIEILGKGVSRPHQLTPWAKVEGDQITYPGEA